MCKSLEQNLLLFKRRTISIDELETLSPKVKNYEQFAEHILELEHEGILNMVKAKGRNLRTPSLAFHYRINKHFLNRTHYVQLQTYRMKFHHAIKLDAYFHLPHNIWLNDQPYLEKINTYIEKYGLPTEKEPAPRRSFELVGNEKWLEEKDGAELLERVGLWDAMNIFPVSDPLMFAVNPLQSKKKEQFHLIVENKTTYQALLPVLTQSTFSSLIYGVGNKIQKSIENFQDQYPVKAEHVFFYFGDIDRSGITIWDSLNKRILAKPACAFYEACLTKKKAYGKTNQRPDEVALLAFLRFFPKNSAKKISDLLQIGAYYPQEVLQTKELQTIWLKTDWAAFKEETQ